MFEEFLFTWQDRLRKLEQPTAMSVKLQGEVDKYKVDRSTVGGITYQCLRFSLGTFIIEEQDYKSQARPLSRGLEATLFITLNNEKVLENILTI